MSETKRIRWSAGAEKWVTAWFGSVGIIDPHMFSILRPMVPGDEWALSSDLPGYRSRVSYSEGPDELKATAERWLSEFVASLGAVFPAEPAGDEIQRLRDELAPYIDIPGEPAKENDR